MARRKVTPYLHADSVKGLYSQLLVTTPTRPKKILTTLIALFAALIVNGQGTESKLCGKKWYPDRIKDIDGTIETLDPETKSLYSILNCDKTFESMESANDKISGNWSYDEKTKTITLKSIISGMSVITKLKVISYDDKSFVYIMKDGGGDDITMYAITK